MKRFPARGLPALVLLILTSAAQAQAPYQPAAAGRGGAAPYVRPPVISPYLNLLNGTNPAVNYYLQVLPQFDRLVQESQLDASVRSLEQKQAAPAGGTDVENLLRTLRISDPLSGTGHPASFNNLSPYFNVRGGRGTGGSQGALPPTR